LKLEEKYRKLFSLKFLHVKYGLAEMAANVQKALEELSFVNVRKTFREYCAKAKVGQNLHQWNSLIVLPFVNLQ
jgi:hypothetical protein